MDYTAETMDELELAIHERITLGYRLMEEIELYREGLKAVYGEHLPRIEAIKRLIADKDVEVAQQLEETLLPPPEIES